MTAFFLALALFAGAQQPATPHREPHHRHAERRAAPATPKPAAELTADLDAQLHAGLLAHESVAATVSDDAITLTGRVRRAENKGQATRVARKVATHDGWRTAHVYNKIEVD